MGDDARNGRRRSDQTQAERYEYVDLSRVVECIHALDEEFRSLLSFSRWTRDNNDCLPPLGYEAVTNGEKRRLKCCV